MRTKKPSKTMLMFVATAVAVGLLIEIIRNPPTATPIESLATYVNAHGTPWQMPRSLTAFFVIAGDKVIFNHCSVPSEGGTRTIGVRRRVDFGHTDIVLINRLPSDDTECYLTTMDGKLEISCYFDTAPRTLNDAENKFKHELEFWLAWQREQVAAKSK